MLLPVALGHVRQRTLSGYTVLWRARTHSADARQPALDAPSCTGCTPECAYRHITPPLLHIFPPWSTVARHHCVAACPGSARLTGSLPRPPLIAKFLGRTPYFAMSLLQSEPWHLGTCTARKQTHTPPTTCRLMAMTSLAFPHLLHERLGQGASRRLPPLCVPESSPSTEAERYSRIMDIQTQAYK